MHGFSLHIEPPLVTVLRIYNGNQAGSFASLCSPRSNARSYKTFSCSTQLSMILILFTNVKMPTIVSRINKTSDSSEATILNFNSLVVKHAVELSMKLVSESQCAIMSLRVNVIFSA